MKIVVDNKIPCFRGVLEPFAEVVYINGSDINNSVLKDVDALFVRTRTKCDQSLLEGTNVKFIASATIGTDHIDLDYLKKKSIVFSNAPGCNAKGVMQYVHTALFYTACKKGIDLRGKKFGVIGYGNTGKQVALFAEHLGFEVLKNDPPLAEKLGDEGFVSLDYLLSQCDIVSCHIPMDTSTYRLASSDFFHKMKKGSFFINASRGEVVDDEALISYKDKFSAIVIDVWNGEPSNISRELAQCADIATPHIAGYSSEGKINGTAMVIQSFARYLGIKGLYNFTPERVSTPRINVPVTLLKDSSPYEEFFKKQCSLTDQMLTIFPITDIDNIFRRSLSDFERIRGEYTCRTEFVYY